MMITEQLIGGFNIVSTPMFFGNGEIGFQLQNQQEALRGRNRDIFDKIMTRIKTTDSNCWIWTGPTSGSGRGGGYGRMYLDGQTVAVHIVMFTIFHGYIPSKKQIDHVCENRLCCNPHPNHLEMVSHEINQKRKQTR